MPKVALFFGSFNPIHMGHLIIANYMANHMAFHELWLVVSPHNPLKNERDLIPVHDRLEMARLATANTKNIYVSDVELALPQPSYTIDTLTYLDKRYPEYHFSLIMGSDSFNTLDRWKDYQSILQYPIHVYPRYDFVVNELAACPLVKVANTPQIALSATLIRQAIYEGKNIQFFVPDAVIQFIERKNLYR